jgi:hypothetical protein
MDAAFKGSGVKWFVRKCPAEEDGTMLQMQTITFQQNESYGLHGQTHKSAFQGLT